MVMASIALGMFVPGVSAQSAQIFAGEWRPVPDAKRGASAQGSPLASVRISQERTGWMVQTFAACTPKPCDWGAVPLTILESRPPGSSIGLATWHQGSATRMMTFKLGEDSLIVEIYNVFSGARDQPSYFLVEELVSTKAVTKSGGAKK